MADEPQTSTSGWEKLPLPRPQVAPQPSAASTPTAASPAAAVWEKLSPPEKPSTSWPAALWEGIKRGGRDVLEGGAQIGARMQAAGPEEGAGAFDVPAQRQALPGRVDEAVRQSAQAYQQDPARQAHPLVSGLGRLGSNIAATAPLGAIPGAGSLPFAGRVGAAALQGGLGAGVLSGGDPKQAAIGGALGAVPGAAAAAIGPRIQPTFQAIANAYPDLARMATGALGRTKDAFQTATANFALRPIGAALDRGTKLGKDLLDQVGDKVSAAYDAVLPHMTFRATTVNPATGTSFVREVANLRSGLPSARERDFDRLIADRITKNLDANGNMTGPEWKRADHIIGDKAARYERSSVADEQEYGAVLRQLQENLRDTLALHNPQQAPALQRADQAWSRYVQMQRAAGRRIADDEFTPSDLLYSARQSTGTRRFAQSGSEVKAFGRAGDDLLNGRAPQWRKYFPESVTGTMGAAAGGFVGHRLAGPVGAMAGAGAGGALGAGAGHVASQLRQHPIARGVGRAVERVGGPAAATAAGEDEPHVSTVGP